MPKVYNKRDGDAPSDAVYVGRPSVWGNPFVIGKNGTREEVVKLYKETIVPIMLNDIKKYLKDKDLVCWCAPLPCHADVLLEVANAS